MTNPKLDKAAIKARAEKATPGPWYRVDVRIQTVPDRQTDTKKYIALHSGCTDGAKFPNDGEFIAHARTDIPALLEALEAAEGIVKKWRYHSPGTAEHTHPVWCKSWDQGRDLCNCGQALRVE